MWDPHRVTLPEEMAMRKLSMLTRPSTPSSVGPECED